MPNAKKPSRPRAIPIKAPSAARNRAPRNRPVEDDRIPKKTYDLHTARLRERLVDLQVELKEQPYRVLLIVAGVAGAGRGDVLNTLGGWLDPRGVETFSFTAPTDDERTRPFLWRFWRSLPAKGKIGVYAGSWYTETLAEEALP
jgi:polyphosphate kinase 2 (PPK2 family)